MVNKMVMGKIKKIVGISILVSLLPAFLSRYAWDLAIADEAN
jgi:hypothetical protein